MQFAYDAAITVQLMRFTPSILQRYASSGHNHHARGAHYISLVSFVSMHWSGACKTLQERISCEIQERLSSYDLDENANKEHVGQSFHHRRRTEMT